MIETMTNDNLLASLRALVRESGCIEADLLVHLGEVDERKLYLARTFSSMFAYCVDELGFSEDAAYNRIVVARAGRRLPALIEAVRSIHLHLAGARLLASHLTPENHLDLLAEAAGKSKKQIDELIAKLFPKPPAPASIRKLPERSVFPLSIPSTPMVSTLPAVAVSMQAAPTPVRRIRNLPAIQPLAEDAYKIQFTASRTVREKVHQAQELLRHRVPNGDLAAVFEAALDSLIHAVKKERFGLGRKTRPASPAGLAARKATNLPVTRHIPDGIKRAVYERDGGRCTFTDDKGRRCVETGALEFDHLDGFARSHSHSLERIRLLCRPHNQYAAELMFGRAFMNGARSPRSPDRKPVGEPGATCPGTSPQFQLFGVDCT